MPARKRRAQAAESGFTLILFAFDQHNLIHCDSQPQQHRQRLLRADLRVEYREFEGGLVEYVLRPMLENRILRGGTIGANLAA